MYYYSDIQLVCDQIYQASLIFLCIVRGYGSSCFMICRRYCIGTCALYTGAHYIQVFTVFCVCDRLIYWTDWGAEPKIEKANMDSTNRKVIISTGLGRSYLPSLRRC